MLISGLPRGFSTCCLRFKDGVATATCKTRFRLAGWLAFAGRELNPLDRYERFPSCYISSPFPEFILTLDGSEHDGVLGAIGMTIRGELAIRALTLAPQTCIR